MSDSSERVVLVCEECGERMVLDETLLAWQQKDSAFGCECGTFLTPADRLNVPATKSERRSWPWIVSPLSSR